MLAIRSSVTAVAVAALLCMSAGAVSASEAILLRDIKPVGGSDPQQLTRAGGLVYFTATDGEHGRELWVTDGTTDGTRLVKDIRPGSAGSEPGNPTRVGSRLFFSANDGSHGRELWVSDGTRAGTRLVKDLIEGAKGQAWMTIADLGGTALFGPADGDLWRTDGTPKGTRLVRELVSVDLDDTAVKGKSLVFPAGGAVWKTDGTSGGTRRISPRNVNAYDLTRFRGLVWFTEFGYPEIGRLWMSDGTKAGTRAVPGVYAPWDLTVMGDTLYFNASTAELRAARLFSSDGTAGGTDPVRPRVRPLHGMVKEAGHLWMARMSEPMPLQDELWVSDGTATGTVLAKDGSGDWVISDEDVGGGALDCVGMDGSIWFAAGPLTETEDERVLADTELWTSDGTADGTIEVADLDPDGSAMPRHFVKLGDSIIFSATDGVHGRELWRFSP